MLALSHRGAVRLKPSNINCHSCFLVTMLFTNYHVKSNMSTGKHITKIPIVTLSLKHVFVTLIIETFKMQPI